jgi:hypothetical protein
LALKKLAPESRNEQILFSIRKCHKEKQIEWLPNQPKTNLYALKPKWKNSSNFEVVLEKQIEKSLNLKSALEFNERHLIHQLKAELAEFPSYPDVLLLNILLDLKLNMNSPARERLRQFLEMSFFGKMLLLPSREDFLSRIVRNNLERIVNYLDMRLSHLPEWHFFVFTLSQQLTEGREQKKFSSLQSKTLSEMKDLLKQGYVKKILPYTAKSFFLYLEDQSEVSSWIDSFLTDDKVADSLDLFWFRESISPRQREALCVYLMPKKKDDPLVYYQLLHQRELFFSCKRLYAKELHSFLKERATFVTKWSAQHPQHPFGLAQLILMGMLNDL